MAFNLLKYNDIKEYIKKKSTNPVKIIAVSKNHPISSVKEAITAGIREFGENRVQEAQSKFSLLKKEKRDLKLHLTGPLQTNKAKDALNLFDVFHTLDRQKLVIEFNKYPDLIAKKIFFIQINIAEEQTKSGILPNLADDFINYCKLDIKMNIVGLMCIPPIDENPKPYFLQLKNIALKNNLTNLSMGMSGDYEEAIASNSTHIRIGTKLFGVRTQ